MKKESAKSMELKVFKKELRNLLTQRFKTIVITNNGSPFFQIRDLREKALAKTLRAQLGPHPTQEQTEKLAEEIKEILSVASKQRGVKPKAVKG